MSPGPGKMSSSTLLDLCLAKTAQLLKEDYWPIEASDEYNPFADLPSHINEELISVIIKLSPSRTLSVTELYLPLYSGRIKNFKLESVQFETEEFICILAVLSSHGMQLKKLIMQNISCLEVGDENCQSMNENAIESLLMKSPNLEHIQIGHEFDIKALQHIRCLKHLELHFVPQNKLFDLIPKTDDGAFIPNETISHIHIFENSYNVIPVEELAFLLQHCTELTSIENNIAGALEFLHGHSFCGSSKLTKEYKLRKYILGDIGILYSTGRTTSVTAIQIAAVTCPQTRELEVVLNNHQAVVALADFKYLESISIYWKEDTFGDFGLGLQSVLQIIGSQLKHLSFFGFDNVDFEIIGKLCPFLVEMRVIYSNEVNVACTDHAYFTCLTRFSCQDISGMKSDTLLFLLRNCKELNFLLLRDIPCVTDELLTVLLKKNSLLKLEELVLRDCSLTEQGVKFLVKSCPSLKSLWFSSSNITFEEAKQIAHKMNPFLSVS